MDNKYMEKLQKAMNKSDARAIQKELQAIFDLGIKAGIQSMMDKIQLHCELGKPVMANGELYFFKTAQENLIDIMDDIESAWNEEHKVIKFIIPLKHPREDVTREVIIRADTAERAYLIALGEFEQGSGWTVDTDYQHYKQLKG